MLIDQIEFKFFGFDLEFYDNLLRMEQRFLKKLYLILSFLQLLLVLLAVTNIRQLNVIVG